MDDYKPFWETQRFKDACLSKLELPLDIVQTLHDWVKKDSGLLFFGGNPGVGKSYFCAAYIHRLKEKKQQFRYFSEYRFYGKIRETMSHGWDYEREIHRIADTKYFILDDIGTARNENLSDFQKEALHILLDIRYNEKLPTLITSNFFLSEIKKLISHKFYSRLNAKENTKIEFNGVDKREEGY